MTKVATTDGDTAVTTEVVYLYGFIAHSDGTNDVTVDIEDGTTDVVVHTLDTSVFGQTMVVTLPHPVRITGGLNVTVTGTNGYAEIFYGK